MLVTCQKKNDDLAIQYEDVHGLLHEKQGESGIIFEIYKRGVPLF
jgi:hypothetical protein